MMRRALSRDHMGKAKGSSSTPKAKGSARAKRPFHVTAGAKKDAAPGTNIDRHLTMYERSVEQMKRRPKKDKTAEDIAEEEAKVRAVCVCVRVYGGVGAATARGSTRNAAPTAKAASVRRRRAVAACGVVAMRDGRADRPTSRRPPLDRLTPPASPPTDPAQNFSFKPKMFTRKKKKKKKAVEPASPKAAAAPPPGSASPTGKHLTNDELVAMLAAEGAEAKGSAEKAEVR